MCFTLVYYLALIMKFFHEQMIVIYSDAAMQMQFCIFPFHLYVAKALLAGSITILDPKHQRLQLTASFGIGAMHNS